MVHRAAKREDVKLNVVFITLENEWYVKDLTGFRQIHAMTYQRNKLKKCTYAPLPAESVIVSIGLPGT